MFIYSRCQVFEHSHVNIYRLASGILVRNRDKMVNPVYFLSTILVLFYLYVVSGKY